MHISNTCNTIICNARIILGINVDMLKNREKKMYTFIKYKKN